MADHGDRKRPLLAEKVEIKASRRRCGPARNTKRPDHSNQAGGVDKTIDQNQVEQ